MRIIKIAGGSVREGRGTSWVPQGPGVTGWPDAAIPIAAPIGRPGEAAFPRGTRFRYGSPRRMGRPAWHHLAIGAGMGGAPPRHDPALVRAGRHRPEKPASAAAARRDFPRSLTRPTARWVASPDRQRPASREPW